MTNKAVQFGRKPAPAATPGLLLGLAVLASAIAFQPSEAGVAPPASEAARGAEAIPKPRPVPERKGCAPPTARTYSGN